ncbi:MAG: hypothetical protein M5T61_13905 [Acidimicrobiia bacterium]|nr:hypothetical protein [Acidimicrobiia bacterium]
MSRTRRRAFKRTLGAGLLAGAAYGMWRWYRSRVPVSGAGEDWQPQPFPYPPFRATTAQRRTCTCTCRPTWSRAVALRSTTR